MNRTAPNCKIGAPCGKKCQPKQFNCPSEKGEEVNQSLDAMSSLLSAFMKKADFSPSPNKEQKAEESRSAGESIFPPRSPHQHNLLAIAKGESPDTSLLDNEWLDVEIEETMDEDGDDDVLKMVDQIKADGPNTNEAKAIALWMKRGYMEMNGVLINPRDDGGEPGFAEVAGIRAAQGLAKLPPYDRDVMAKEIEDRTNGREKIREDGTLQRMLNISEDKIDEFLEPYIKAEQGGEDFRDPTFMACCAGDSPYIDGNVEIIIEPKAGGQGKMIAKYMQGGYEGEVLFPPYTQFGNVRIERVDGKVIIRLTEI